MGYLKLKKKLKNNRILNISVGGTGPYYQKEMLIDLFNKNDTKFNSLVWLFYEGNDHEDLKRNYGKIYNFNFEINKDNLDKTLGEVISNAGKTQVRIAETEKYPHVTFFFNGGRENPFQGEERILCPSPKVATYDLKPEMSAYEIVTKITPEIESKSAEFICLNFANPDMVGHTGNMDAAIKAIETVDRCIGKIVNATGEMGGSLLITADHGNAELMKGPSGEPWTCLLYTSPSPRD